MKTEKETKTMLKSYQTRQENIVKKAKAMKLWPQPLILEHFALEQKIHAVKLILEMKV